jgi:alpha-L-glutamate ligase-like protein
MLKRLTRLRKNRRKVLGLNERYLEYIRPHNLKSAIRIADDKVLTKEILQANNIPVPTQIAVIKSLDELDTIDFENFPKSFVIKPVHGLKGGGVDIFYNRDKEGKWIRNDGSRASMEDIRGQCNDIIDGKYSLHNESDTVLIEERIKPHKVFRYHTYKGTPDVRVIIFNSIPVMAMLRLPTQKSFGKANLDLGAIGAGIDMAVGKTTSAVYGKSGYIEKTPHTRLPISGLKIPFWERILRYSIEASQATELGFAAIDFLIDNEKGPVIVELNARPGLSIQLANQTGLRQRVKKATGIKVKSVKHGIRLAKDMFGGEIEEVIEAISGKDVIGIYENISLFGLEEKEYACKAKIDTGADSTSIDREIAMKLGFKEIIDELDAKNIPEKFTREEGIQMMKELDAELIPKYEYLTDIRMIKSSHGVSLRPSIKINLTLGDTTFETNATIYDRSKLEYPAIIGRKSLTRFLVDPSKK